jgi:cytochrome c
MFRFLALILVTCSAFSVSTAKADTSELQLLLQKNNCLACHLIDKRKYGPNLKEVAQKYAGDSGAIAKLAAKIKAGGTGVWGEDVMPPQAQVSDADAQKIAKLVLSLE